MQQDVPHDEPHLPPPSPWPLVTAIGALLLPAGLLALFAEWPPARWLLGLGALVMGGGSALWWAALVRESRLAHVPHPAPARDMRTAMLFFIGSEAAFFGAFFAYYFHHRLVYRPWPPPGSPELSDLLLPALNTALLIASGLTYIWAERSLLHRHRRQLVAGLSLTLLLGSAFVGIQAYEWRHVAVTLASTVGTPFFVLTGFHGAHVIAGLVFVAVNLARSARGHFSPERHTGLQICGWYWHFVDVVWLILFAVLYVW